MSESKALISILQNSKVFKFYVTVEAKCHCTKETKYIFQFIQGGDLSAFEIRRFNFIMCISIYRSIHIQQDYILSSKSYYSMEIQMKWLVKVKYVYSVKPV